MRIIGGKWKRRKLRFPDRPELRPSLDRVRETLFNWLAPYIVDARCLDLFAGTGVLGFEALSRGAAHVTMVERDRRLVSNLERNRELLGADPCVVVRSDALRWLSSQSEAWDIIFIDPPFRSRLAQQSLSLLAERELVHANSLVYLEQSAHSASARADSAPAGWAVEKSSAAGATHSALLRLDTPD